MAKLRLTQAEKARIKQLAGAAAQRVDLRYGTHVLDGLKQLDSGSVQTVVTSPPYWMARDNEADGQIGLEDSLEAYVDGLVEVFDELARVLRDDGAVWLNVGDKFLKPKGQLLMAPYRLVMALQDHGWILRSIVVWHKPGAMPRNVHDRPTDDYEPVFLLAKQRPYYYDGEDLRTKSQYPAIVDGVELPVTSNLRTVWSIVPENFRGVHTSIFPADLARHCILLTSPARACAACGAPWKREVDYKSVATRPAKKTKFGQEEKDPRGPAARERRVKIKQGESWSPSCECHAELPEDERPTRPPVVLDPFSGSGTTAAVASFLGRRGIGIDLNPEYKPVADARVKEVHERFAEMVVRGQMTEASLLVNGQTS